MLLVFHGVVFVGSNVLNKSQKQIVNRYTASKLYKVKGSSLPIVRHDVSAN